MGTARWCPPEKHGWQFHSARGVEEIAPPPLNSSIARDERERGGRGARFAGWNSRRQKRAETGGSHTRAPFLSNFPAAARANSTEFLSSSGTRFPSGFRPTDVATLCSQPPHLLPLSFSSIKIRRRDEPRVSFQSVMSPPTIQRGRFRCWFPRDSRVGRRTIQHRVYIGRLHAGLMFSRGDTVYGGCINLTFLETIR